MIKINGIKIFRGELEVPGDKSISHRSLMISALSSGKSKITGLSKGQDVIATKRFIELLGADVTELGDSIYVEGGTERLCAPNDAIDVGNSGTLIRIGAGLAAGIGGEFSFYGDASVNKRPMKRVFDPLRKMGADIFASNAAETAPFTILSRGLKGIRYQLPIPSAQVKSSILFAGLGTKDVTTVIEPIPTRRHTEEMLKAAGANITVTSRSNVREISVSKSALTPANYQIPGDPSQAAFWIVAGLISPNSEVTVKNIYIGQLRSDFIEVLRQMGADIDVTYGSSTSADVTSRSSSLRATEISGPSIAGLIDEIPILAVAASVASGTTRIGDAAELRVKESDRISTMVKALRSFGVTVIENDDGMEITGGGKLHGGEVQAKLDHRIAMSCAILGSAVEGTTVIEGFECVGSSYPGFLEDLTRITAVEN